MGRNAQQPKEKGEKEMENRAVGQREIKAQNRIPTKSNPTQQLKGGKRERSKLAENRPSPAKEKEEEKSSPGSKVKPCPSQNKHGSFAGQDPKFGPGSPSSPELGFC